MRLLSIENKNRIKENYFSVALFIFIYSFYCAPTNKFLNNTYYILVLLPFCIYSFINYRKWLAALVHYKLYVALCVALILSSVLNGIEIDELGHQLTRLLYVTGFIGALAVACQNNTKLPMQILHVIVYSAFLGAVFCLFDTYFVGGENLSYRLVGRGALENPILLSSIHGVAIFCAAYIFSTLKNKVGWLYLFLMLPSIAIVFLTQSRGPLLALVVTCLLFLFWLMKGKFRVKALITTVLAGCMLITAAFILEDVDSRLVSLDGPRPAIWGETLKKIVQKPIVGYGLQEKTDITAPMIIKSEQGAVEVNTHFQHPHSAYLTTLLHGGFLAFILLLMLLIKTLFCTKRVSPYHFILVFGLIYVLFDAARLFTPPKELWLIIWLPLGMLLAIRRTKADDA